MRSEFQISFIDCWRTSPITSLRPQSRKHELTETVGVHRIAVENIRAGIGVADVLLVDALADLDAGVFLDVELRPAGREILDEDAVAVIAEGVEELLALRLGDEFAWNLDDDLAVTPVGVDPFDVVDEFREIELESGKLQIGFLGHAVDRNIDLVDAGLEHGPDPFGCEEGAVGGRVDVLDGFRFPGVGDHLGQPLVEERLAVLVHAQDLDGLVEFAEVVDDFLEHFEFHHALEAPGLCDHVAMAGRAEGAFEVAGTGRIGEHHERRRQRDDRFQCRAPCEIDSRLQPSFHGVSLQ